MVILIQLILKKVMDIIISKGGIIHPQIHFIKNCPYISDSISKKNLETLQWIINYATMRGAQPLKL